MYPLQAYMNLNCLLTHVCFIIFQYFPRASHGLATSIYINKQSLEKVQLEFEIRIQFCTLYLNLCVDHSIIIHLSFNMCLLIFVSSELMKANY